MRSVVRELVYLSDRKLRQFLPDSGKRVPRGMWQVNTPLGGFGVQPDPPDADEVRSDRLRQVVKHVSTSARWFSEPNLSSGSWIQFEAPMNYRTLRGAAPGMALFVDPPHPVGGYGTGGAVRLLLHGSAQHLGSGQVPVEANSPAVSETRLIGEASDGSLLTHLVKTSAGRVINALSNHPDASSDDPPALISPLTLAEGTQQLLIALDRQLLPETAAWMRGFARVTAALNAPDTGGERIRYVIGTPLYVEYVPNES
ncbi:SAVMC3_10250 family protein [Streptomyces malaysiensis]